MKIKDGKLSLGKRDIQVGNFVLSKEKMHFKMQDINGYWSTRVAFMHPMYMLLEECVKAGNKDYIEAIAKILYAVSTISPDGKMLQGLYDTYSQQVERMKEKGMITEKEDNENLEMTKKALEAKEHLKEVIDGKPESDTQGELV